MSTGIHQNKTDINFSSINLTLGLKTWCQHFLAPKIRQRIHASQRGIQEEIQFIQKIIVAAASFSDLLQA